MIIISMHIRTVGELYESDNDERNRMRIIRMQRYKAFETAQKRNYSAGKIVQNSTVYNAKPQGERVRK